jgi:DoxX-like family
MTTRAKTIGYWATTGFLALGAVAGGAAQLARVPANVEAVVALGYPVYLLTILGLWKVLAAAALLAPGLPRVKEWAYAGLFFVFTGATASHLVCRDAASHAITTIVLAIITVASWALRPESRTLGALFPVKASTRAPGYAASAATAR